MVRGFQDGDPAQDKMVIVEAFDSQDHKSNYISAQSQPRKVSLPRQTLTKFFFHCAGLSIPIAMTIYPPFPASQ